MKNLNDGYAKIITDETLRETISHGSEEYPFRYYYEDIWLFDLHCIDWHWNPERSAAQRERLDQWLDRVPAPLVIEIGAGRAVATVRHFSQRLQQRGSRLIRINLHEADGSNPQTIAIAMGARAALEAIASHFG